MRRAYPVLLSLCGLIGLPAPGAGLRAQAVTEILFDPASAPDADWEWVEVYNPTDDLIELDGFVFDDDDGLPLSEANVHEGTIPPGKAVVLYNAAATTLDAVTDAWGDGIRFVAVAPWPGLNQDGDRIGLWPDVAAYGDRVFEAAIDEVAYGSGAPWPRTGDGASIYLTRRGASPAEENNDGDLWSASSDGVDAAFPSAPAGDNESVNVGSPGVLPGAWLPVELTAFEAVEDNHRIVLTWATSSERNNAGFDVLIEIDGAFERIAFVPGAGTTDTPRTYTFRHRVERIGRHRFRLKQIDFDGAFHLSSIRSITVGGHGGVHLDAVYPNPLHPTGTVRFGVQAPQHVDLALIDPSGRQVRTLFSGFVAAQTVKVLPIDGSGLASGVYYVTLRGVTGESMRRVVVLR